MEILQASSFTTPSYSLISSSTSSSSSPSISVSSAPYELVLSESSESVPSSSSSSLTFSKTFFKSFLLNEEGHRIRHTPSQSQSQLQMRSSTVLTTQGTTTHHLDVPLDQQCPSTVPADDTTNRPITIQLPPELWFLILRYATFPPFPWSTTTICSSPCSSTSSRSDPSSSYQIHQNSTTIPFHIRLTNYTSEIKWKASLTRVCKEWNLWGQEFLWEDVWIASGRDGRVLVGVICGGRTQAQGSKEKDKGREGQGEAEERRESCNAPVAVMTKWGMRTEARVGVGAVVGKEKRVAFRLRRPSSNSCAESSSASRPIPITNGQLTTSSHPHPHPQTTSPSRRKSISTYIKKLHIETPSMDRCCPSDLMSILDKCQRLEVFIDLRSVRRGFGFVGACGLDWSRKGYGLSVSVSAGEKEKEKAKENALGDSDRRSIPRRHLFPPSRIPTPDPILQTLLHLTARKTALKHLTFTNYEYDSDDFEGGVRFWEDIVAKALAGSVGRGNEEDLGLAATLESLEVVMSTRGVGMGNGRGGWDDYGYGQYARRHHTLALGSTLSNRGFEAGLLTSLNLDIKSFNPSSSIALPSLHSLRIPLTSPTLLVISTWSLPSLQSLSVVSIDFTGWRRMGFKKFMDVHGGGLVRFEIVGGGGDGESGEEEGWITEREEDAAQRHYQQYSSNLHLPSTSPNLKHFICSSNASEWNWETPDWIAPHVLMPEHFGVERIGVWGLEGKVLRGGDWEVVPSGSNLPQMVVGGRTSTSSGRGGHRRTISTWTLSSRHSDDDDFPSTTPYDNENGHEEDNQHFEEQPFFMLQEQFGSLLRREAFPSLVCIRDMSWESDLIRRSVGIGDGGVSHSSSSLSSTDKKKQKGLKAKSSLASFKETVASRFASFATTGSSSPFSSPSPSPSPSSSTFTVSPPPTATVSTNTNTYCPPIQTESYKIRKFWLGVLEMCNRRGVYLEDWMGRKVVA